MGFPDRIERTGRVGPDEAYDGNTEGWAKELGETGRLPRCRLIPSRAGPDVEVVAEQVFTALADPTRRAVLAALARD
jgi:hypothetical protein